MNYFIDVIFFKLMFLASQTVNPPIMEPQNDPDTSENTTGINEILPGTSLLKKNHPPDSSMNIFLLK